MLPNWSKRWKEPILPFFHIFPFLVALIFICSEVPVLALSVTGSLMNTFWARENQLRGRNAEDATNLNLYEYARLRASNIGSDRLSAYIRGRIGWKRFPIEDEHFTGRLYQGYINYRLPRKFDLRLGRQFLPNDVGFWQMDGVRLGIKSLGPLNSRFYGGVAATPWMVEKKRDGIAGIELSRLEVWRIQSRISFLTVFDKDRFNNVILGMRLDVPKVNLFDVHRNVHKRLSFSGRGSIDLLTQQVISGYGYLDFSPLSPIHLSLEYQHETPIFPADSIFSIFAFEPLQQATAIIKIDILNGLELYGRYARQFFDDGVPINRYSTGFTIKSRYERIFGVRLERLSDVHTKYWRIHSYIGKTLTPRLEVGFNHYYKPSPQAAYDSVQHIMNNVRMGWLIRQLHAWGANLMILMLFLHMMRVFLYGAYKPPREMNWMVGVILLFLTLMFAFTGYLLPWDQLAFWAVTVGTEIFASFPIVGKYILVIARSGENVTGDTLARFFALHVIVLPVATGALIAIHLFMVRRQGISGPL